MKAILRMEAVKVDCKNRDGKYRETLELLKALDKHITLNVLDERQFSELANSLHLKDDEFLIDWDKYDYISVAKRDSNNNITDLYSFKSSWLNMDKESREMKINFAVMVDCQNLGFNGFDKREETIKFYKNLDDVKLKMIVTEYGYYDGD